MTLTSLRLAWKMNDKRSSSVVHACLKVPYSFALTLLTAAEGKRLTARHPRFMSDDASQTVYHVACALQLATDLLEIDPFLRRHQRFRVNTSMVCR